MNKKALLFVTGNANKLREIKHILGTDYELSSKDVECISSITYSFEIAKHKALQAYSMFKQPIIIEDTCLCFNAYGGLPGPFFKWFQVAVGDEGLGKMVKPFEDKTAYTMCSIGYMSSKLKEPIIFVGRTDGEIVEARGTSNYGWDKIFLPLGFNKTYAEMTKDEKNSISHRSKAVKKLKEYLDIHLE